MRIIFKKINLYKIILFFFIFLFFTTNLNSYSVSTKGLILLPEISIGCNGFDKGVGKVFETYNCDFNYSFLRKEEMIKGCRFLLMDETTGDIYYNQSFQNLFIKQKYLGEEDILEDFYEYSTNKTHPISFVKDGRHIISFSFEGCEGDSDKVIIETRKFDILSTRSY